MKLCFLAQILLCTTFILHEKPGDFQCLQLLWLSLFTSVYVHLHICVVLADAKAEAVMSLKQQQQGLIYDGILLTNDSPHGRA